MPKSTVEWLEKFLKNVYVGNEAVYKKAGEVILKGSVTEDGDLKFVHRGTTILEANIYSNTVSNIGGAYSRTDSRWLNQILRYFDLYHPQLRYTHNCGGGCTLVNLYPEMMPTTNFEHYEKELESIVARELETDTDKVQIGFSTIHDEFYVSHDGRYLFTYQLETALSFLNEKDKVDNYAEYFQSKAILQKIAFKSLWNEVMDLVSNGFFDSFVELPL